MFTSKQKCSRALFSITALASLLAGCDDPTLARQPPALDELRVFLILDPDAASQPLLVQPTTPGQLLEDLRGEVSRNDAAVAAAVGQNDDGNEFLPCAARYGSLDSEAFPRCLAFQFAPEPEAVYRVRVEAAGRPPASATVSVPGDFELREVSADGDPPGTTGLEVRWTPSAGAYRYLVALRAETEPRCVRIQDCDQGWFAVTQDTALRASVPAEELAGGGGPWFVDVYAMDRAVYEYLTTGTSGDVFPVPPVQNVNGGYGAMGAWVVRSARIRP